MTTPKEPEGAEPVTKWPDPPNPHSCTGCGVLLDCRGSHREHEWIWKLKADDAEAEAERLSSQLAALEKERDAAREALRLRALELRKVQRQQCVEPGCGEPAPPYCGRHRGDWLSSPSSSAVKPETR